MLMLVAILLFNSNNTVQSKHNWHNLRQII